MSPTKRDLRKCVSYVLSVHEKQNQMLAGEPLKSFCASPKNKRCIDILEDMGALGCIYYDERSELIAVYPTEKAAKIEFRFGAEARDKALHYVYGFFSGLAVWAFTEYLIPWLALCF